MQSEQFVFTKSQLLLSMCSMFLVELSILVLKGFPLRSAIHLSHLTVDYETCVAETAAHHFQHRGAVGKCQGFGRTVCGMGSISRQCSCSQEISGFPLPCEGAPWIETPRNRQEVALRMEGSEHPAEHYFEGVSNCWTSLFQKASRRVLWKKRSPTTQPDLSSLAYAAGLTQADLRSLTYAA